MARAKKKKNAPSNRTFSMVKFNRIWEGIFMASVISCAGVHSWALLFVQCRLCVCLAFLCC